MVHHMTMSIAAYTRATQFAGVLLSSSLYQIKGTYTTPIILKTVMVVSKYFRIQKLYIAVIMH